MVAISPRAPALPGLGAVPDPAFAGWAVRTIGEEKVRACIQCGVCSGVCPLSDYMDYTPRRLIHLAKEGFREHVLRSFTIWLCASCYACAVQCPKGINVTDVMFAFKQRAMREGVYPKRFAVPVLEHEFTSMVRQRGRVTESWLVVLLALKTNVFSLLKLAKLGWRLLRAGRMAFGLDSIKRRKELQLLLDAAA
jgi:heterodisulfide reductase subunit C